MIERPRIIDVLRKPRKCPVCGERVVDVIYGTGDMTDVLLFEKEKKVMFFPERTKGLCSFERARIQTRLDRAQTSLALCSLLIHFF